METPIFSTASTILTQSRAETKVGAVPSATALQDTAMLRILNDVNSQFVNDPYSSGLQGWKFLRDETLFESFSGTTINGALAIGATAVTLTSGTNWPDPAGTNVGAGWIKSGTNAYDFFLFEDRSGTSLTTVSGIDIAHSTSEETEMLYRLPSNYGKPRALFVDGVEYFFLDMDFRQVPSARYYNVKSFTSTNSYSASFLILPEDVGARDCTFYYMKRPTTISATTTSVDAPDGNGRRFLIEELNAYTWNILGEFTLAAEAKSRARDAIQKCLDQWATHTVQSANSIPLYF